MSKALRNCPTTTLGRSFLGRAAAASLNFVDVNYNRGIPRPSVTVFVCKIRMFSRTLSRIRTNSALAFMVALAITFWPIFSVSAQQLIQTLDDPTVSPIDFFGASVDIEGNLAVVGANIDSTFGLSVGQAHLFNATTATLLRTFDDPTLNPPASQDNFGSSVSLLGDHVLIGAPGDQTNGFAVGQAHLFNTQTGALLHTFELRNCGFRCARIKRRHSIRQILVKPIL